MRIKVDVDFDKDFLKDITNEIGKLNDRAVEVGIFDGEMQWLAAIHEYGCHIEAKKAQYLTVPVHPAAKGKRAADFNDLFFYEAKSGEKFLARKKGKKGIEIIYWLTKSVNIPERSFLRSGFDDCIDDIMKISEKMLDMVASGKMTADQYLDMIGQQLSSKIKTFARDLSDPPNSPTTQNVKGSSNPLVDTGQMINSITWRKQ